MARVRPTRGCTADARDLRDTAPGWHVYLLRCGDGSLYAGATNDLVARLARHAAGKGARYTRARLPVALVYREPAADRSAALRREAALKRLRRAEKLALVGRSSARTAAPRRRASGGGTAHSPLIPSVRPARRARSRGGAGADVSAPPFIGRRRRAPRGATPA